MNIFDFFLFEIYVLLAIRLKIFFYVKHELDALSEGACIDNKALIFDRVWFQVYHLNIVSSVRYNTSFCVYELEYIFKDGLLIELDLELLPDKKWLTVIKAS